MITCITLQVLEHLVSPLSMDVFLMQFLGEPWQTLQDGHRYNLSPLPFPQEQLAIHCEAS